MVPPTEQGVVGEIDPGDDMRRAESDLLRLGKVVVDAVKFKEQARASAYRSYTERDLVSFQVRLTSCSTPTLR
jgi:hypothetical protein